MIRLPSDVLFAFGSAELTPAAKQALAAVDDEIGSGGTGMVTIEGHTDAIGGDADNQGLSERRAAAVRAALEPALGSGFQYSSVGFGETKPVAPNTRPDGSDDPDGRALNRRVEIRTGSAEPGPSPTLEPMPVNRDLADAGLRAEVAGLERRAGYLMARLTVTNPTAQAVELAPGSGLTPNQAEPTGLTLADRSDQLRQLPCRTPQPRPGLLLPGQPDQRVLPGRRDSSRPAPRSPSGRSMRRLRPGSARSTWRSAASGRPYPPRYRADRLMIGEKGTSASYMSLMSPNRRSSRPAGPSMPPTTASPAFWRPARSAETAQPRVQGVGDLRSGVFGQEVQAGHGDLVLRGPPPALLAQGPRSAAHRGRR